MTRDTATLTQLSDDCCCPRERETVHAARPGPLEEDPGAPLRLIPGVLPFCWGIADGHWHCPAHFMQQASLNGPGTDAGRMAGGLLGGGGALSWIPRQMMGLAGGRVGRFRLLAQATRVVHCCSPRVGACGGLCCDESMKRCLKADRWAAACLFLHGQAHTGG